MLSDYQRSFGSGLSTALPIYGTHEIILQNTKNDAPALVP